MASSKSSKDFYKPIHGSCFSSIFRGAAEWTFKGWMWTSSAGIPSTMWTHSWVGSNKSSKPRPRAGKVNSHRAPGPSLLFSLPLSQTPFSLKFNISMTSLQSPSDLMPLATHLSLANFDGSRQRSGFEGLQAMVLCPRSDWNSRQKWGFEGLLAMSRCPGSDWKNVQKSNFEGLMAMSRCQCSDWSDYPKSDFEVLMAKSRCPGSDWKNIQKSNFEGLLAMSRCPGSDWSAVQKSRFEGLLAMSRCPGSDWKHVQKSNFEDLLAMWRYPGSD